MSYPDNEMDGQLAISPWPIPTSPRDEDEHTFVSGYGSKSSQPPGILSGIGDHRTYYETSQGRSQHLADSSFSTTYREHRLLLGQYEPPDWNDSRPMLGDAVASTFATLDGGVGRPHACRTCAVDFTRAGPLRQHQKQMHGPISAPVDNEVRLPQPEGHAESGPAHARQIENTINPRMLSRGNGMWPFVPTMVTGAVWPQASTNLSRDSSSSLPKPHHYCCQPSRIVCADITISRDQTLSTEEMNAQKLKSVLARSSSVSRDLPHQRSVDRLPGNDVAMASGSSAPERSLPMQTKVTSTAFDSTDVSSTRTPGLMRRLSKAARTRRR